MKKLIKMLILLLGIVCLYACSNSNGTDPSTRTDTQAIVETSVENTSETVSETIAAGDATTKDKQTETTTKKNTTETTTKQNIPEYVPGTVKLLPRRQPYGPETDAYQYDRKYRLIYYSTSNFNELFTQEELEEWDEIANYKPLEKEFEEMELVRFIKFFNIPKEVFAARVEYWEQRRREVEYDPVFDAENGELPNVDVLYTFDNEIINRYYRYE